MDSPQTSFEGHQLPEGSHLQFERMTIGDRPTLRIHGFPSSHLHIFGGARPLFLYVMERRRFEIRLSKGLGLDSVTFDVAGIANLAVVLDPPNYRRILFNKHGYSASMATAAMDSLFNSRSLKEPFYQGTFSLKLSGLSHAEVAFLAAVIVDETGLPFHV